MNFCKKLVGVVMLINIIAMLVACGKGDKENIESSQNNNNIVEDLNKKNKTYTKSQQDNSSVGMQEERGESNNNVDTAESIEEKKEEFSDISYEIINWKESLGEEYYFYAYVDTFMQDFKMLLHDDNISENNIYAYFSDELKGKMINDDCINNYISQGGEILSYDFVDIENADFISSIDYSEIPVIIDYKLDGNKQQEIYIFCIIKKNDYDVEWLITDILPYSNK